MKTLKVVAILLPFCTLPTQANEVMLRPYLGVGANYINYQEDSLYGVQPEADFIALSLVAGAQFNPYFSAEARAGFGVEDDSLNIMGINVNTKLVNHFGVYLKGEYPISRIFSPYIVAGYTNAELEVEALGMSSSGSDSGLSYGLGAKINFANDLFGTVEYMSYLSEDTYDLDGFTVSFHKKF